MQTFAYCAPAIIAGTLLVFITSGCTKAPQGVTVRCEEDEYVEDGECVTCPAGSTNTSDAYAGGDTKCEPTRCGVNQRVEEHRCVDCEPGTTRTAGDEATGENTFCEVSVCSADEHVQGGECVACPAGTTNEPGDRRTDGDSPCEPVLCQLNERVESNICVACEPGTANDAGDDSSAGDTACDVTTCELDHFVESNTCVPCPDDTINDAGDAANGPDSSCRDAICQRNERVSLRQCVPCTQDMINLPGDHAALGDTVCESAIASVSTGFTHTCAVTKRGEAYCWGSNEHGELGFPPSQLTNIPTPIALPEDVTQVSASATHTCALLDNGAVWCWGSNQYGQLGTPPTTPEESQPPIELTAVPPALQVVAGVAHSCALTTNSKVYCWGSNIAGQLGIGSGSQTAVATEVPGLPTNLSRLVSGPVSTCALTNDRALWCWGSNAQQELTSETSNRFIHLPQKIEYPGFRHETLSLGPSGACILSESGDVYCRGIDLLQSVPPRDPGRFYKVEGLPTHNIVVKHAGRSACALNNSNTISCWGALLDADVEFSPPRTVPEKPGEIDELSASVLHACSVTTTGRLRCWGHNNKGQLGDRTPTTTASPSSPTPLSSSAAQIVAGTSSTCALLVDGTLECWGSNLQGQLGNGTTDSTAHPNQVDTPTQAVEIVQISSYLSTHACAISASGKIYCWGDNQSGQLGDLTRVQRTRPTLTSEIRSGAQQVVVGSGHTCALSNDHEIFCWGANNAGQLATSTPNSSALPLPITLPGSQPTKLASGSNHICALTMIGDVMCWGGNYSGQIDASDPAQTIHAPQIRSGLGPNVVDINANGSNHTCAVLANGSLQCWGENQYGQLGNGNVNATANVVTIESDGAPYVQVSPGAQHTCAIRSDGSVWCWGDNQTGRFHTSEQQLIQTPIRIEGLSPAVAISSGINHTCALDANGLMLCWGSNVRGQLGGNRLLSSEDFIDVEF